MELYWDYYNGYYYRDKDKLGDIESLKEQIESYKEIIREKKFTIKYRKSCQEAIDSLETLLPKNEI